ncbi:MAG: galactokinase [Tepidisphaeraceae bacterium]|jgi:galactokinase
MAQEAYHGLKQRFIDTFGEAGGKIHLVRAPGRVNLIGEHTDYNDGFVFPMAIEPEVIVACRVRQDDRVKVVSTVFGKDTIEFSVQKKIEAAKPPWGNYVRGVAAELLAAGIPLCGMEALISNTLSVGGGLSSSAALEVAIGRAMILLAGLNIEPERLALICQRAEIEFAGVPCGIMDQEIVAAAKAGSAMLLDCRNLSRQFVPILEKELRVVIVNSMVKHEHSGGQYALRRKECEETVAILKRRHAEIKSLRDATLEQLEAARGEMSDTHFRRGRHVITENARTVKMAEQLGRQYYEACGELMAQSHASLRDDFEVSCPELDFLVEESVKIKGVYGARMTGGGFGGCMVALAQPRSVEWLCSHLHKTYTDKFGRQPTTLVTAATAGASVIE